MMWQKIMDYVCKFTRRAIKIRDHCKDKRINILRYLYKQFPDAMVFVTDSEKIFIYKEDMKRISIFNVSRFRKWKREKHDCENFAYEFKGIMSWFYGNYAFGIVFVYTPRGKHALNCFLDEFGKFNYFEPQTNEIFQNGGKRGYEPYLIII